MNEIKRDMYRLAALNALNALEFCVCELHAVACCAWRQQARAAQAETLDGRDWTDATQESAARVAIVE